MLYAANVDTRTDNAVVTIATIRLLQNQRNTPVFSKTWG